MYVSLCHTCRGLRIVCVLRVCVLNVKSCELCAEYYLFCAGSCMLCRIVYYSAPCCPRFAIFVLVYFKYEFCVTYDCDISNRSQNVCFNSLASS